MTTPPNHSDDEIAALKLAVIVPLTNFVALSNIVFTDFHGQEKGEDPKFDKFCKRQDEAEKELYAALQAYVQREVVKELELLKRRSLNGNGVVYGRDIDVALAALKAKGATHE